MAQQQVYVLLKLILPCLFIYVQNIKIFHLYGNPLRNNFSSIYSLFTFGQCIILTMIDAPLCLQQFSMVCVQQ